MAGTQATIAATSSSISSANPSLSPLQTIAGNFQMFLALLLMEAPTQSPQQMAQASKALTSVDKAALGNAGTTMLSNSSATWDLDIPNDCSLTISIANCTGQTVFSENYPATAGSNQPFSWSGKGDDGTQWPDGRYRLTAIDGSDHPVDVRAAEKLAID